MSGFADSSLAQIDGSSALITMTFMDFIYPTAARSVLFCATLIFH